MAAVRVGASVNILELRRLRDWCIKSMGFDHMLYVDEIISGGMMRGHVNEMMELGVTQLLPVKQSRASDAFGTALEGERLPRPACRGAEDSRVPVGRLPHADFRRPEVHARHALRRSRVRPACRSGAHGLARLVCGEARFDTDVVGAVELFE